MFITNIIWTVVFFYVYLKISRSLESCSYIKSRYRLQVKVTGIVDDLQGRTDFIFQEFLSTPTLLNTSQRGNFLNKNWNSTSSNSQLFVKVADAGSLENIQSKLDALAKEHTDEWNIKHNNSRKFVLQPLINKFTLIGWIIKF